MNKCCKRCLSCCAVVAVLIAVLVALVLKRGLLLLHDVGFLPCPIGASSNNLMVAMSKVGYYKLGVTNNSHDAAIFPSWMGIIGEYMAKGSMDKPENVSNSFAAMKHRLNRYTDSVAARISKVGQVAYIGAGFDTKLLPFVEDPANADKRFFEMDLPDVAASRRCLLGHWNASILDRIDIRGCDLNNQSVHEVLGETFSLQVPSLYLEEATFVYIERDRRTKLVRDLLQEASCGSIFSFYFVCSVDVSCISPIPFKGRHQFQAFLDELVPGGFQIQEWASMWMYNYDPADVSVLLWMLKGTDMFDVMYHKHNESISGIDGLVTISKIC